MLVVPPLVLLLAGFNMLLKAPPSWGVAAHVGMPDWLVSFCALVFGAPPILMALLAMNQILRVTERRFSVFWAQLPLAVVPIAFSLVSFGFSQSIADPASYDHLATRPASPGAMLAGAIMVAIFVLACVWGCTHVYAAAFVREYEPTRDRAAEIDRIEGLLRQPAPVRGRRDVS